MTFPLFDYITPLSARPDPNGGVANGMAGIQSFTDAKRHKADQAQQNSQFQQKFGLEVNDQLMRGDSQQHEQRKDAVSLLGKYNEFLANGDDASAAGLAPALKALGVDLSPSDAPGQSPQDWHAQQSAPASTPVAQPEEMPKLGGANAMHLDPSIAPTVPKGAPRPFAPGESVTNPGGSWSSERTMTVSHPSLNNGAATNIPSIWIKDGKPYQAKNEDEAVQLALQSGLPFKSYGDISEADKASIDREDTWQKLGGPKQARGVEPLYNQAKKSKRDIPPPLMSKFMAAQPPPVEPTDDGQGASMERIRGIGGDPSELMGWGMKHPQPASPGQLGTIDVEGHDEPTPQATPPAAAQAPRAGGLPKYQVSYRGEDLGVIDPNLYHAQNKGRAERMGAGFVAAVPESLREQVGQVTAPADNAKEQAFAIENEKDLLLQAMRSAANKGGKGGVPNGEGVLSSPKEASRFSTDVRGWVSEYTKDNATKDLNKVAVDADNVVGLLDPGESNLATRVAVGRQVKALFGAAASEGERGFILGGQGEFTRLEMQLDNWMKGGELPANFKAALRSIATRSREYSRHRVEDLGKAAADKILNSPIGMRATPEQRAATAELIISTIAGEYGIDHPTASKTAAPKKPGVYQ